MKIFLIIAFALLLAVSCRISFALMSYGYSYISDNAIVYLQLDDNRGDVSGYMEEIVTDNSTPNGFKITKVDNIVGLISKGNISLKVKGLFGENSSLMDGTLKRDILMIQFPTSDGHIVSEVFHRATPKSWNNAVSLFEARMERQAYLRGLGVDYHNTTLQFYQISEQNITDITTLKNKLSLIKDIHDDETQAQTTLDSASKVQDITTKRFNEVNNDKRVDQSGQPYLTPLDEFQKASNDYTKAQSLFSDAQSKLIQAKQNAESADSNISNLKSSISNEHTQLKILLTKIDTILNNIKDNYPFQHNSTGTKLFKSITIKYSVAETSLSDLYNKDRHYSSSAEFVKSVFQNVNLLLPTKLEAQATIGYDVPRANIDIWGLGDRMYFAFAHSFIDSTGIYMGDGHFIYIDTDGFVRVGTVNDENFMSHLVALRRSKEFLN